MVYALIETTSKSVLKLCSETTRLRVLVSLGSTWFHLSFEYFDVISVYGLRECRR